MVIPDCPRYNVVLGVGFNYIIKSYEKLEVETTQGQDRSTENKSDQKTPNFNDVHLAQSPRQIPRAYYRVILLRVKALQANTHTTTNTNMDISLLVTDATFGTLSNRWLPLIMFADVRHHGDKEEWE